MQLTVAFVPASAISSGARRAPRSRTLWALL
jgi:hypothetical protein